MPGKDKKPEIRFTGFTDDWEPHKVGEVITELDEYTTLKSGYSLLTSSRNGLMFQDEYRDNVSTDNENTLFSIVPYGKCTYRHMSDDDIFHFNINYIAEKGLVSREYPVFDAYGNNSLSFIVEYLNSSNRFTSFCKEQKKGGTRTRLYYKNLCDFTLFIPKYDEQLKLATFLSHLDSLITLHQGKYDKLVIVKKSMLEKMFPKDGANVPEIRFAGFTDAWEQRELSAYLDTSSKKNSNGYFSKSDVLSVSGNFGIVNQIEFQGRSYAGASVSNYGIVDNGDVVYTKSPLKENPYGIIKTNKGKPGIVSTLYAVYKPKENTNPHFVQCYFESDYRLNKYLKPLVNKGAKNDMKVSDDNALTGLVTFPSYDEQARIAEFLECLDNLITPHQRKLEKLKNIKNSMLEKMFVQEV